jgi:hypothetical protein
MAKKFASIERHADKRAGINGRGKVNHEDTNAKAEGQESCTQNNQHTGERKIWESTLNIFKLKGCFPFSAGRCEIFTTFAPGKSYCKKPVAYNNNN